MHHAIPNHRTNSIVVCPKCWAYAVLCGQIREYVHNHEGLITQRPDGLLQKLGKPKIMKRYRRRRGICTLVTPTK